MLWNVAAPCIPRFSPACPFFALAGRGNPHTRLAWSLFAWPSFYKGFTLSCVLHSHLYRLFSLQGADLDEATVEGLVREFAASWKSGIDAINQDVLAFFSNFRNGMEILKQV